MTRTIENARRCATCANWNEGASPLATAAPHRNPLARPNIGTCSLYAPVAIETTWFPVSVFPEVHGDRVCTDWEPAPEPDDGERAEIGSSGADGNIVRLERAA